MRISDWSSDVCSSDLARGAGLVEIDVRPAEILRGSSGEPGSALVVQGDATIVADRGDDGQVAGDSIDERVEVARAEHAADPEFSDVTVHFHGPGRLPVYPLHNAGQWLVGETKVARSEEHTSELQSLKRISYDVLCLTK